LIADESGDEAGLLAAMDAMPSSASLALQGDAAELAARLALRRNEPTRAVTEAVRAQELRRDTLDYRGLARALALAGEGARRAGDAAAAADFFLRAGRSAALRHDTDAARLWLRQAGALGQNGPVAEEAGRLLQKFDVPD
jgi:hypothetical protein